MVMEVKLAGHKPVMVLRCCMHSWATLQSSQLFILNRSLLSLFNLSYTRRWKTTSFKYQREIQECRELLKVSHDCDAMELKQAFLQLAKKYHPDSGSTHACATTFAKIEAAYRTLSEHLAKEKAHISAEEKEEQDFEIKHTVPQHRQYLSFDGVGAGTPAQRQKQYQAYRAAKASENVLEHRIQGIHAQYEDSLVTKDKREARKIKTRYGMERLVEDLIQESMARGDFENLPGKGKPLKYQPPNPYVDTITHKLNQVLVENGYMPEWILLEKEIREEKSNIKCTLSEMRARHGAFPLDEYSVIEWSKDIAQLEDRVKTLNKQIVKYNLVVPILQKQMLLFDLKQEAQKTLEKLPSCSGDRKRIHANKQTEGNVPSSSDASIIGFFLSLLK